MAADPTIWKWVEICGRMTCHASATAGTVMTWAHRYIHPVFHAHAFEASCFDHWYTEPASG